MKVSWFAAIDNFFISTLRIISIPLLRTALGIVFLWFGALKLAGASPVAGLIETTYSFFPSHVFLVILGIWEVLIGIGLLAKLALRFTLTILWLQMA